MESTSSRSVTTGSHFEIDNYLSDFHMKYGYYRIIISESSFVKYLAIPDPAPSFPDVRGEKLAFTTVPDGDWNIGYLISEAGTHRYSLGSTEKTALAGINKTWHSQKIDYMALKEPDHDADGSDPQLKSHMFFHVYKNHFGFDQVIVSYEWFPESVYGVEHETEIYALIDGHQIAPKFLAHVMEQSGDSKDNSSQRVIGYMVGKVPNARVATLEDLPVCKEVLARLHDLGIAHGALRPGDFLVINDDKGQSSALLQAFTAAYRTSNQSVLDAESKALEYAFQQAAAQREQDGGFSLSVELSDEIRAISLRDGGLHPHVIEQAKEGRITITAEEHRALLAEMKREDLERIAFNRGVHV